MMRYNFTLCALPRSIDSISSNGEFFVKVFAPLTALVVFTGGDRAYLVPSDQYHPTPDFGAVYFGFCSGAF